MAYLPWPAVFPNLCLMVLNKGGGGGGWDQDPTLCSLGNGELDTSFWIIKQRAVKADFLHKKGRKLFLLYNKVQKSLAPAFPVLAKILNNKTTRENTDFTTRLNDPLILG